MSISMIVAMGKDGVIGNNGSIPWMGEMPDDMKWFKEKTTGRTVVMGRKTLESLPTKLKNREYIVVSSLGAPFFNLREALEEIKKIDDEVFIIGGETIYNIFMPYADTLYVTHIYEDFDGDTYFPSINAFEWETVSSKYVEANEKNKYNACYIELKRKSHP